MLSLFGLLAGLVLLIVLTMRGVNLFILAPLCALLVAVTNGIPFWQTAGSADFIHGYMNGFAGFVSAWFLMFLLGSLFGKLMDVFNFVNFYFPLVLQKTSRWGEFYITLISFEQ